MFDPLLSDFPLCADIFLSVPSFRVTLYAEFLPMKARAKCILLIEVSGRILILEEQILWWSYPFHPPAWKSPQSCPQTWPVHPGVELSHSWALLSQKQQKLFLSHSTLCGEFAFFQIILHPRLQSEHKRGIGCPWFCDETHLSDGFGELTAPQIQC